MADWGAFRWGDGSSYGGGPSEAVGAGLRYRLPGLLYRSGLIYRGLYGGGDAVAGGVVLPRRRGVLLRLFDPQGRRVAEITTNSGRQTLHKLSFELLPTGPGAFDMELTELPPGVEPSHEWRVDVHLWNSVSPIYSGYVQEPPLPGGTDYGFAYEGHGYFGQTERVLVSGRYEPGTLVHQAVDDLVRREIEPRTGVLYRASKIEATTYRLQSPLKFLNTPFRDAMRQLANLAGGWEWGVDELRHFWFRAEDDSVIDAARLWVGKHVETAVFRADSSKVLNHLRISQGQVRNDLASDHPLYKTNWLEDPLEDVGVGSSQERYGIRMGVHRAPNVLSPTDAVRSAAAELRRRRDAPPRATVKGLEFQGVPITCRGLARIASRDGRQIYLLAPKRARYRVEGARVAVDLELGDLEPRPYHFEAELVARQAAEELARQASQQQL